MRSITILGAGSWGTAIAIHLARNGHRITLWDRDEENLRAMQSTRRNSRYLSDFPLPKEIDISFDLSQAVADTTDIFVAVPSHAFSDCLTAIKPSLNSAARISWGSKGLSNGELLHNVAHTILGEQHPLALLSGPSFATEVAKGLPTAITIASDNPRFASDLSHLFHSATFRPYISTDMIGVEISGVVKNVLAIAIGISDGIGYGANARCALITRGLAEMVRLGTQLGGHVETFYGLAGVGDLILTATDNQSRNRRFGLALGEGMTINDAKAGIGQVVEGARNAAEVHHLAQKMAVEMPIAEQVYALLYENLSPQTAVANLLSRDMKSE